MAGNKLLDAPPSNRIMALVNAIGDAARAARGKISPWNLISPADVASFAPGGGLVQAWDESGKGRDALKAGQYGQAAVHYGNMALNMLPEGGALAKLAIFAGPAAKTANLAKLADAQKMAEAGKMPGDIRAETGWFKGADGNWRFEIPDDKAVYNASAMQPKDYNIMGRVIPSREGEAGAVLSHDALYEAYPDLKRMTVGQTNYGDRKASYHPPDSTGFESIGMESHLIDSPDAKSSLLHELQHAVQEREGFAKGGSVGNFKPNEVPNPRVGDYERAVTSDPMFKEWAALRADPNHAAELAAYNELFKTQYEPRIAALEAQITRGNLKEISPQIDAVFEDYKKASAGKFPTMERAEQLASELARRGIPLERPSPFLTPQDAYRSLAGEVEARNVQRRMDMTPDQRFWADPWVTQDMPNSQQIIRYR